MTQPVDPLENPFSHPEVLLPRRKVDIAHIKPLVDIIEESSELVSELNGEIEPTTSDYRFVIEGKDLLKVWLPNSIADTQVRTMLKEIIINISHTKPTPAVTRRTGEVVKDSTPDTEEVSILFANDDKSGVYITNGRIDQAVYTTSEYVLTETQWTADEQGAIAPVDTTPFVPISDHEVLRMLASIKYQDDMRNEDDIDTELFLRQDLLGDEFRSILTDILSEKTQGQYSSESFALSGEGLPEGSLSYAADQGRLTNLNVALAGKNGKSDIQFEVDCTPGTKGSFEYYTIDQHGTRVDILPGGTGMNDILQFVRLHLRSRRQNTRTLSMLDADFQGQDDLD